MVALMVALSVQFWPDKAPPVITPTPVQLHPIALIAIQHCGVMDDLLIVLSDGSVHELMAPRTDAERAQTNLVLPKLLAATKQQHYVYHEDAGCV